MTVEKTPLYGCVLIGGKSSRMGRPKHLIERDGVSWLEHSVVLLETFVDRVFISGDGELPGKLCDYPRIEDVKGIDGPISGFLAALRSDLTASWLFMACDMPLAQPEAVQWLVEKFNTTDSFGVVPKNPVTGRLEPLFACYRQEAVDIFSRLADAGRFSVTRVADSDQIATPYIPEHLVNGWANINYQKELEEIDGIGTK